MEVKLLEVDKDENLILLAKPDDPDDPNDPDSSDGPYGLDGPSELQLGDSIWGVIKEITETRVIIDLG